MNYDSREIETSRRQAEAILDTVTYLWRAGKHVVTTVVDLARTGFGYIGRRVHHD